MLPKGWVDATIGDVAETKLGKMLDAAKNKGEPIAYLRNINVRWGEFDLSDLSEMRVTPDEREELSVRYGDLFVCEGGEPGRCAVWREPERTLVFQKAIHRVRPKGDVEPEYLARHIAHVAALDGLSKFFTGTTIKHLPQVALQRISLPLPPLAEQRRIVAKLDALTARLARARAELERVSLLGKQLRNASLSAARKAAVEYPTQAVSELLETSFDGPFGSHLRSADYTNDGVQVVRLENVSHLRFVSEKKTFISFEKFATLTRHSLRPGDVIFSSFVDNDVRVCRLPRELPSQIINKADCFVLRVNALECDAEYLTYALAAPETYEYMRYLVHGATRPRIGLSDLRNYKIHVPDLEHQRLMVREIKAAFARADRLEAEAARARALLDRLEAAILAKAFRGELVPQDPADEPASVLLDRIRAERVAAPKPKRGRRAPAPRPEP